MRRADNTAETGTARWLWRHVPAKDMAALSIGMIASGALVVVSAPLTGAAFDLALTRSTATGTILAAGALLVSQLARAVVVGFRQARSIRLGARFERDLRAQLIDRVIGGAADTATGHATATLISDARAVRFLAFPGLDLVVSSVATLALIVAACAFYGGQALVAPVVYSTGYAVTIVMYLRGLAGGAGRVRGSAADLTAVLDETLDALETVRDSHLSEAVWRRVSAAATAHRDLSVRQGWVERRAPLFLLLGLAQAIGFWIAVAGFRAGAWAVGEVVGYVGLLMMLGIPTFSAYAGYPRVASGLAAAGRIREALGAPSTEPAAGKAPGGLAELRFAGVEFGYPLTGPIIRGADFTVPARGLTVIAGAVGSGKSSLARLMAGVEQPDRGTIALNGHPVAGLSRAEVARWVAMIDDAPAMFSVSIEDNIRLGRDGLTEAEVAEAVKRSCADDFIAGLPDGPATRMGAGGVQLSGGERQRLALARAVLTSAPILVLDDPFSALDADTAQRLDRELLELSRLRSVVVVTDRPAMLRRADLILHIGPAGVAARQGEHHDA